MMDNDKLDAVTTFKLTRQMSAELDAMAARETCTKDAAIRKLVQWGLFVESEMRALRGKVVKKIAIRELKVVPESKETRRATRGGISLK